MNSISFRSTVHVLHHRRRILFRAVSALDIVLERHCRRGMTGSFLRFLDVLGSSIDVCQYRRAETERRDRTRIPDFFSDMDYPLQLP